MVDKLIDLSMHHYVTHGTVCLPFSDPAVQKLNWTAVTSAAAVLLNAPNLPAQDSVDEHADDHSSSSARS